MVWFKPWTEFELENLEFNSDNPDMINKNLVAS